MLLPLILNCFLLLLLYKKAVKFNVDFYSFNFVILYIFICNLFQILKKKYASNSLFPFKNSYSSLLSISVANARTKLFPTPEKDFLFWISNLLLCIVEVCSPIYLRCFSDVSPMFSFSFIIGNELQNNSTRR